MKNLSHAWQNGHLPISWSTSLKFLSELYHVLFVQIEFYQELT